MVAGEPIGVDLLIGNAQAFAQIDQGGPGASLETAAGDTGPQGGGVTEYSDNLGDAIDLLVAQGVIPPVQLEFGLIELEEIGRAHVCTPVTNAHLVCRLLLEKK